MQKNVLFPFFAFIFLIFSQLYIFAQDARHTARAENKNELIKILQELVNNRKKVSDSLIRSYEQKANEFQCRQCLPYIYTLFGAELYSKNQYSRALINLNKAGQMADSLQNDSLRHSISIIIGRTFERMGLPDKAIEILENEREYALRAKDSANYQRITLSLSDAYSKAHKQDKALEYCLDILDFSYPGDSTGLLPNVYNRMAVIYMQMKKNDQARKYLFKALENAHMVLDNDYLIMSCYSNLSNFYLKNLQLTDSAVYYGRKAVNQANRNGLMGIAPMINLGNVFEELNMIDSALFYYREAEKAPELGFLHMHRAAVLINIGYIEYRLENYASSEEYLQRGIEAARLSHSIDFEEIAQKTLFELDSVKGNYHDAIAHQQEIIRLKDSLYSQRMSNKVNELNIVYETELLTAERDAFRMKNELNERIIKKQNYVVMLVGLAALLLLTVLIIILKHRRKLRKLNTQLAIQNQQLKEQKNTLEELNITKDKFFSIIAHDLRSPFNLLSGYLDLLDRDFDDFSEDEKKDIIKELKMASANTYDLLENLLEWARTQRGMLENKTEKLSVLEEAKAVLKSIQARIDKKEQVVELHIADDSYVFADRHMTRTLILNLVNNSVKFTPKGGKITLECFQKGNMLWVCIEDNGVGIPAEKQKDLLGIKNPYKTKGTENEKGTGLGLVMCAEFIEILGGELKYTSQLGKGSRFCFSLPKA